MYSLVVEDSFEAAHFLRGMPKEHKCSAIHGHSYKVAVEIDTDKLNELGMVVDFSKVKEICRQYDHKYLNDLGEFEILNPTAENLAAIIGRKINHLFNGKVCICVEVQETEGCKARWHKCI